MEGIEKEIEMDFYFTLSLKQCALLRIADSLWTKDCMDLIQSSVNLLMANTKLYKYETSVIDEEIKLIITENFRMIFIRKITRLCLPKLIKDALYPLAEKVGIQKAKWYYYQLGPWNIQKFPSIFYYTSWGSIDRRKSALNLIRDDTVHICKRYFLACFYCYEDEINNLSMKEEFSCVDSNLCTGNYKMHMPFNEGLPTLWTHLLRRKQIIIDFDDEKCAVTPAEVDRELLSPYAGGKETYFSVYRYSKEAGNNFTACLFRTLLTPLRYFTRSEEAKENGIIWNALNKYASNLGFYVEHKEGFLENAFFLLRCMTASRREEVFRMHHHLLSVFSNGCREKSLFLF